MTTTWRSRKKYIFPAVLISSTLVGAKYLYYRTRSPPIPNALAAQARNVCPVVFKKRYCQWKKKDPWIVDNIWKPDAVGMIKRVKKTPELDDRLLMASFHDIKSEIMYCLTLTVSHLLMCLVPSTLFLFIWSHANNLGYRVGGANNR